MSEIKIPEHGEVIRIDCNIPSNVDLVIRIIHLQNNVSIKLGEVLAYVTPDKFLNIPCKQCMRDIALEVHDLSEAILELIGDKVDKK